MKEPYGVFPTLKQLSSKAGYFLRHMLNISINISFNRLFLSPYSTMENEIHSTQSLENSTFTNEEVNSTSHNNGNSRAKSIRLIQTSIASVGIVANLTVIITFLNHEKLRRKIPNIFIINQVRML